jgi:hypothetical protein
MKTKLSLILLIFSFNLTMAQNAYYDALIFYSIANDDPGNTFETANLSGTPIFSDKPTIRKFLANPFDNTNTQSLNSYLPKLRTEYVSYHLQLLNRTNNANGLPGLKLANTITPGFQSMAIDAAAKIIAEDFQDGVTVVYINKFKERLDKIPELRAFFPKTYQFFQDTNPFDYPKLGKDFKAKFEEDLKALVINVKTFIESASTRPWSDFKNSNLFVPYCVASDIGDKLLNGSHPTEVLDYLEQKYTGNVPFAPYLTGIRLINIIQSNFQKAVASTTSPFATKQFENIWLQYRDLKKLTDNPIKIRYLVGLIYQQDPALFASLIPYTDQTSVERLYNQTILPSIDLLMNIDNICQKKNLSGDELSQILGMLANMIQNYNRVYPFLPSAVDFSTITIKLTQIYSSIAAKDYSSIVSNTVFILNQINKELNANSQTAEILKVTSELMKYGTFITDVVNAKNSDDIKEAYRKAAVNRGTFIDKRLSLSSLTISAHPGLIGGVEQLSEGNKWEPNFGITAPIGLEFTWGFRGSYDPAQKKANYVSGSSIKSLRGSNFGVMLAFADIGAVFNYRLNDSESELPQELTFKQIFSPGVALHYGFKNSPLTLGVGGQYTPELRKVTVNNISTEANSIRYFIRLTWDIPLVKMYYKREKM